MKILAINGSPNGKNGNTDVMLQHFLKGCKRAGGEVETVYLKDKNIHHCSGCFNCWTKTPGKCIHKDDMGELLDKILQTDIMVYATPLYYFTVTGIMKDFMDRMLPLNSSEIVKQGASYSHPGRFNASRPKTVLISNCGFPGKYNFSGLVETFKVMTKGNLVASILCDKGGALKSASINEQLKQLYMPFFSALETAGKEIVSHGHIEAQTESILSRDIIEDETYVKLANSSWRK
ncbi:flavodoxin family protein [Clostridium tyrobutyricum]|uniref:flavodoxin family protein n=1 Tax=Clostridium tyrobutyricum TaxID=1519 RepID=UPI0011CB088F|nr:flavodoxin family protein [Clostridium tyrobutyricum]